MKNLEYAIYKYDESGVSSVFMKGNKKEITKKWNELVLNAKPGDNYSWGIVKQKVKNLKMIMLTPEDPIITLPKLD
jgi:hypothetical protein